MDNDFATGYALGSDSGNNNCGNGMWGGDGWWAIIRQQQLHVIFLL